MHRDFFGLSNLDAYLFESEFDLQFNILMLDVMKWDR